jgi:hypothetical protein
VCYESITVSGAEAVQASKMGAYTKAGVTQGDRPVYQRAGSTLAYLFYWPSAAEWRIGGNYTSGSSGVKSSSDAGAACPDQANGWQALTGGAWDSTYPITVAPAAGQTLPPILPATAAPTNIGNAPAPSAFSGSIRVTVRVVLPHERPFQFPQARAD